MSAETEEDFAGRRCPYCHTDLVASDEVRTCDRCGAVHHADCWEEGAGCSVFGCQGEADSSRDGLEESFPDQQARLVGEPDTQAEATAPRNSPEEDFSVERRAATADSRRLGTRRRTGWLVAAALLLAAGVAGAILLLGADDNGTDSTTPAKFRPKKEKTPGQKQAEAEREAKRNLTLRLEPVWVDDPGGQWTARLPQGDGWTKPESEGDLNDDSYNPLYRTMVWGPEGFVVVDTSPAEDPIENQDNYTVAGEVLEPKEIPSGEFAFGQMVSYKNGEDECSGAPCVKAMLSDGVGGGVTVWVKSGSMKEAKTIAKAFAESAERGY
ncbi:MAG TPA: RING finger protein [Solirubrobacterales bacterium]|nr:RING finger protein [Solirubrobacterales bacterium]